ncbi:MAG: hypothetical protein IT480_04380 [Gammaproteobacteria bacterium]|nr:hypothetical protein [Gammaproteobacteria bacterium]
MLRQIGMWAAVATVFLATDPSRAEVRNPPPTAAFAGYQGYELRPLEVPAELQATETGQKATAKIQEHLNTLLAPVLEGWNAGVQGSGNGLKLVFEPRVLTLRFIGGAKRFWAGAMAGDSRVLISLKIVEQPGGRVLGEPQFYQQSAAMAGAWSIGAHDNTMLSRVVELAASYCKANRDSAVGGPTGQ